MSAEQEATALRSPVPTGSARRPARRWLESLAVTLFFAALTIAMTWPWALHMGEAINPFGDVVVQMTSLSWNAHALATNPFGLFEAPFFYPYSHSLAFSENLLGQTITTLPVLWATNNPALAANINILLSFVLTGLFTYLLVRDLTRSRASGLFAGVVFAFCGFRFMQMGHLHMLATQWFPFTLWALTKALNAHIAGTRADTALASDGATRPGRWLAWFAFGFVAMGLSSVYYTYFLAMALLLYLLWWVAVEARGRRVAWGRLVLGLGVAAAAIAVVLAPVFIPYLQSNSELGFSRSTYEVQNWAAEWSFFGNVLQSNWLYAKVLAPAMASAGGERELFPGIVPALLAVVGIVWGRGRGRFFYVLLGAVALVLTFGLSGHVPGTSAEVPLPYAFLYDWVPGFKALRVPVRFSVLLDFAIYVLAGYGLARLQASLAGRKSPASVNGQGAAQMLRRAVLPAALTALALVEMVNPLDTGNRRDVAALLLNTEPYGWLARPENAGPVLELPMTAGQDDVWYTFFATRHWQPLVNGWSSFVPPGTVRLKQALAAFPDPFTVSLLQGLEVRHVVVHLWQFPRDRQADLKQRLDATKELELADRAGDNYVYRLTPDPWLRGIAAQAGSGSLWVGEDRHDSMPTLEVLAYAINKWGPDRLKVGGNINAGYKPLGALPFGTPPDYAVIPSQGETPFGLEGMKQALQNPAVRLLEKSTTLVASYDLTAPGGPRVRAEDVMMGVGARQIAFEGSPPGGEKANRSLDLTFVAFSPATATVRVGDRQETVSLPAGVSVYSSGLFETPARVEALGVGGGLRLVRVDMRSVESETPGLAPPNAGVMPLAVEPSVGDGEILAAMTVVGPQNRGDYTATIDVYVEPWGTHPNGHFGSWSVVLPADGAGHSYSFKFDPIKRTVTTMRDGSPVETFAWLGPPTQGDFRASLVITKGESVIENVPLALFTVRDGRLTTAQADPPLLAVVHPESR